MYAPSIAHTAKHARLYTLRPCVEPIADDISEVDINGYGVGATVGKENEN